MWSSTSCLFLTVATTALMPRYSHPSHYTVHLAVLWLYAGTTGSTLGLILYGSLTFGKGLGDLFFFLLHLLMYLLLLALGWISRSTRETILTGLLMGAMFSQLVFMALQLTLWRGSKYQWNKQIFLPAPPGLRTEMLPKVRTYSKSQSLSFCIEYKFTC